MVSTFICVIYILPTYHGKQINALALKLHWKMVLPVNECVNIFFAGAHIDWSQQIFNWLGPLASCPHSAGQSWNPASSCRRLSWPGAGTCMGRENGFQVVPNVLSIPDRFCNSNLVGKSLVLNKKETITKIARVWLFEKSFN